MKNAKVKHTRKAVNKTPRDIVGDKNVMALKHAGFVVVPLSELRHLRANVKSVLVPIVSAAEFGDRCR